MPRHTKTTAAIAALVAAIAAVLTISISYTDEGPEVRIVFGQPLTEEGQDVYEITKDSAIVTGHTNLGDDEIEAPPLELENAAGAIERNENAAEQTTGAPLATAEPVTRTALLERNYSSRRGARPALLVVHDTESPNRAGLADVDAIRAWFNNPRAAASSHYVTDGDGNTLRLVRSEDKAWTQGFFNPWSVSVELIGFASQTSWPEPQLQAAAVLFAAEAKRWGIPARAAIVRGCTIVRSGILDHDELDCGNTHTDNGAHFPMGRFIARVAELRAAADRPAIRWLTFKPAPGELARMFLWFRWRLGEGEFREHGARNASVRPRSLPATIPLRWRGSLYRFLENRS